MFYRILFFAAAFFINIFCSLSASNAELRICNGTQNLVGVVIGYHTKDGWQSEGWWRLAPSRCETVIDGPLTERFYYLHAEDSKNIGQWAGPVSLCVQDKQFKIRGAKDCYQRGYQRADFLEIDTGAQTRWTVQLTDPTIPRTATVFEGDSGEQ